MPGVALRPDLIVPELEDLSQVELVVEHPEQLQEESAVLKERRKGREERLLARGVDPAVAAAASS